MLTLNGEAHPRRTDCAPAVARCAATRKDLQAVLGVAQNANRSCGLYGLTAQNALSSFGL